MRIDKKNRKMLGNCLHILIIICTLPSTDDEIDYASASTNSNIIFYNVYTVFCTNELIGVNIDNSKHRGYRNQGKYTIIYTVHSTYINIYIYYILLSIRKKKKTVNNMRTVLFPLLIK